MTFYGGEPAVMLTIDDTTARRVLEDALRASESEKFQIAAIFEQQLQERTAQLTEVNAALENATRLKEEFLATVSHELRTPLTGILGMAEALQEEIHGTLNAKQLHCVRLVEQSGRQLLTMINNILDLTRLEAGQMELRRDLYGVGSLCDACLHMIAPLAERKRQTIAYSITPMSMETAGDYRRTEQILVNLLSNAVKFTPEGGEIGLEVRGDAAAGTITYVVWDKGIGIAPENIAILFQPFVQLDSSLSRQFGGAGLGLALVRRLVELHGGSTTVTSALGQGSRFGVTLPWHMRPAAALPGEGSGASARPAPLLLIVEESERPQQAFTNYLRAKGYRIAVAHGGEEAIALAGTMRPHLILLDIGAQGANPDSALHQLRRHADQTLATTPVVVVATFATPGERERCLAAGADVFLNKPVSLHELLVTVQNLVDTSYRRAVTSRPGVSPLA
jgi:signal transduction histidine kinase/ActR/RegA family two-component response regulator